MVGKSATAVCGCGVGGIKCEASCGNGECIKPWLHGFVMRCWWGHVAQSCGQHAEGSFVWVNGEPDVSDVQVRKAGIVTYRGLSVNTRYHESGSFGGALLPMPGSGLSARFWREYDEKYGQLLLMEPGSTCPQGRMWNLRGGRATCLACGQRMAVENGALPQHTVPERPSEEAEAELPKVVAS